MAIRGLVDANILIYFIDAEEGEKHTRAKKFMADVDSNSFQYVIATQTLRECAHVWIRKSKLPAERIKEHILLFEKVFTRPLMDESIDIVNAVSLSHSEKIPFWDALLASTAKRHGVYTIFTENTKDFERIPGIKAVNPLK